MSHFDPHTNQSELEVQRIIHLQNLVNQLPDEFTDTKKVTKSHVPTANTPTRIDVPKGQLANESQKRLKHGRLFGSKYTCDAPNSAHGVKRGCNFFFFFTINL